jgi:hypothetical protein
MPRRAALATLLTAVLAAGFPSFIGAAENNPQPWKQSEESGDLLNIRLSGAMHTDTSGDFLKIPTDYADTLDFEVAKTPPIVDFGIVRGYEPWDLPILYREDYRRGGVWEGYGDVTRGPDGCFYFSIGDHRSYGGNAYIIRYDPKTRSHRMVVDLRKTMKWTPEDYADSKIHGDLDIDPKGDLWFLSYFGPFPTREEWDTIYNGSRFFHFNIFTGKLDNLGIPLEGSSWPYYNWDWKRGVFFAVSEEDGVVFAYDTKNRKILYAGAPKEGISWHRRCTLLDKDTGIFYSTDTVTYPSGERYRGIHRFVSYTRCNNVFTRMNATVPANPATGRYNPIRAHTQEKTSDGALWCFSENGAFFKFFPAEDRTELIGPNWGRAGYYTANMCQSPGKRYIYYMPCIGISAMDIGTPVVQYDTQTGKRKVLAFLNEFYRAKYGYNAGGPYGIEMDEKGESLFFYVGGGFAKEKKTPYYTRPAMFHLYIPASERKE